ncbi:MAG: hypothetical protein AVDCRST_MAG77-4517, partial [uncultured Chloroflexi bacterium]
APHHVLAAACPRAVHRRRRAPAADGTAGLCRRVGVRRRRRILRRRRI